MEMNNFCFSNTTNIAFVCLWQDEDSPAKEGSKVGEEDNDDDDDDQW